MFTADCEHTNPKTRLGCRYVRRGLRTYQQQPREEDPHLCSSFYEEEGKEESGVYPQLIPLEYELNKAYCKRLKV